MTITSIYFQDILITPKENTMMIKQSLFIPPFPQSLETTSVLSMSMYFLIMDILYNHATYDHLHLVPST